MRENNKDRLLDAAFSLLLKKPIGDISISDIERASGMTKGAVFYYAPTKLEFFRMVIENRVIGKQAAKKDLAYCGGTTLKEFICKYTDMAEQTMQYYAPMCSGMSKDDAGRAYLSILLQIQGYFPDLGERYRQVIQDELSTWIQVIEDAVKSGEVREDIDIHITAETLLSMFYGEGFIGAIGRGFDTESLKSRMLNFYEMLR